MPNSGIHTRWKRGKSLVQGAIGSLSFRSSSSNKTISIQQTGYEQTIETNDPSIDTGSGMGNSESRGTGSDTGFLPPATCSDATPETIDLPKGTPFAKLLDFMQKKEVFGNLSDSSEQVQAFRRNFVRGLQDVYEKKHLARETPRNLVKSYDFQVDGLVVQEACMAAVYETKTTILYFILNSELSGGARHTIDLKRRFEEMRMRLQNRGLSERKPIDIMYALKETMSPLQELFMEKTSDGAAAWAIERYNLGGWYDFGYGVIANGEGEEARYSY